jgi:hypothetical protein
MPKLYRGQGPVRFRGDPLSLRPEIAQEVAIAIAAHCKAEAMLATALAKKLKVDEAVFFELYLGYPNHQRKLMFTKVLKERLAPPAFGYLSELWARLFNHSQWRNDFAHGLWAITDDLPDAILLIQPETSLLHFDRLIKCPPGQFTDLDIGAVIYTKPEIIKNRKEVSGLGEDLLRFGRAA